MLVNDDPVQLLERLDPALHLTGLGGLVAEALDELFDMCDLARLLGGSSSLGLKAFLAGDHEVGEASDVLGDPRSRQFEDAVGHGVDEVPVVADEQEPARPPGQLLFQPGDAVYVEVVGGLVHDQQVGCRQEKPRQRNPHSPAARHLVHGPIVGLRVEAKACQNPVGFCLDGVAPDLFESGLGLTELSQHAFLFWPYRRSQLLSEVVDPVRQEGHLLSSQHNLFEHTAARLCRQLLWQVADTQVSWPVNLADVGLVESNQDFQEGGLSGSVSAYERDPATSSQLERYVAKQGPGTK